MAISKVVFGSDTLIDLTSDTVSADSLLSGYTAHSADGSEISGGVEFVTYYTGSSTPSSSTGSDGDIYLKVVS